jgi:flagellar basal body rod protein FlgB
MAATHPGHIQEDLMRGAVRSGSFGVEDVAFRKLRQFADELSKTGEIKRMYEINTGMVKAFHRMMLLTVREIRRLLIRFSRLPHRLFRPDVQETRMRVLSENLANAQSTGNTPGADAYRRKTISFPGNSTARSAPRVPSVAKIDSIRPNSPSSTTRETRPLTQWHGQVAQCQCAR